jgi:Zn-dependent protease
MIDQLPILIFQLAVLLFSVMIHEISHGAAALALGDTTAKDAGRLTLNPLKHLDPFGSVILPLFLFVFSGGAFVIGWAKPVPYNPFNLKNPRQGAALIGLAGPLSNVLMAVVFAVLIKAAGVLNDFAFAQPMAVLFSFVVFINILLAIFNLLPIPPLDGSNILFAFLPEKFRELKLFLLRYGFWILILFILLGGFHLILGPAVNFVYRLLVGQY